MLTRAEIDDILKLIDGSEFTELRLEHRKGCTAQPFHLGPNTQSGMQASRDAGGSQPWTPAPPVAFAARSSPRVMVQRVLPRFWAPSGTPHAPAWTRTFSRVTQSLPTRSSIPPCAMATGRTGARVMPLNPEV